MADQLTHSTVVAEPFFHRLVDPSPCLSAQRSKHDHQIVVDGAPGEEEEDEEGRGKAALHAEVQRVLRELLPVLQGKS